MIAYSIFKNKYIYINIYILLNVNSIRIGCWIRSRCPHCQITSHTHTLYNVHRTILLKFFGFTLLCLLPICITYHLNILFETKRPLLLSIVCKNQSEDVIHSIPPWMPFSTFKKCACLMISSEFFSFPIFLQTRSDSL